MPALNGYPAHNRHCRLPAVLLLLLLLHAVAHAQAPGIRKYTQLDGYPASKGYEIDQDEKGYIWLGSDNGSLRFDGLNFQKIQAPGRNFDAEILYCRPVGADRILLLPLANEVNYYEKGHVITPAQDPRLRSIHMSQNYCRIDGLTGIAWLSGLRIKQLCSFQKDSIRQYTGPDTPFNCAQVIGEHFIGYMDTPEIKNQSLFVYSLKQKRFILLKDSNGRNINNELVLDSGPSEKYFVTIRTPEQQVRIYSYKPGSSTAQLLRTLKGKFNPCILPSVKIDRNNDIWISSFQEKGIAYFGNVSDTNTIPVLRFLPDNHISSSFVDRNNNIWCSSPENALYFMSQAHFRSLLLSRRFSSREVPQAISGDDSGGICVSYYLDNYLSFYKNGQCRKLRLNMFFGEGPRKILPLGGQRFLIFDRGIALADLKHMQVTQLATYDAFKDVCLYGRQILAAGMFGACTIDSGSAKMNYFLRQRSTAINPLHSGLILVGTPKGLLLKSGGGPSRMSRHPVLGRSNITDISSTWDSGALISTNIQGLFLMRPDQRIQQIDNTNQSPFKNIRSIYRQIDSTYWLITDNGAYRLEFSNDWTLRSCRNFSFYDGLPSNNVTDMYVCRDTAYFTTTQGVGVLIPGKGTLPMAAPKLYISKIQAETLLLHEPDSTVSLQREQNNILFSLSPISYESLRGIQVYYRLRPLQKQWEATSNPEIRFTQLTPGNYTFEAYATNAKGIRSTVVKLDLQIQPAFWQTIYFKVALVVVLLLLTILTVRIVLRRGELKRFEVLQQKKRLAELELEAIKAQINPHFIYNCLNSIKYLNYTGEHKDAQAYLGIFARLIRMTMQYSRRTFITIGEETDYLAYYLNLEQLRFKDKLRYRIDVDPALHPQMRFPAMLLQPYVENALKHGLSGHKSGGALSVCFRRKADSIEVTISDNGPGFSRNSHSDNLGMRLAGTRAESYNELFQLGIRVNYYNKQDTDPEDSGAVVSITFKIILNERNAV